MESRIADFCKVLVGYSCAVEPGERVLIEGFDVPDQVLVHLVREVRTAGGLPFVTIHRNRVLKALYERISEEETKIMAETELHRMKRMDVYIGIRGSHNIAEFSDIPRKHLDCLNAHYVKPVHIEYRVNHTKWVVCRWPTPSMAQQAGMSTEAFESFYFDVCTLDYGALSEAMDPLVALMERTDQVRITGPGTDLSFSIKDIPVIKCDGKRNIPDGEVYTAPVKNSVEGVIQYNAPTLYQGSIFDQIRFEFSKGKIVSATAANQRQTRKLNEILDSDEGARYVGEFALGLNPRITQPMCDILFDEKIAGSLHLTPGAAYRLADNGNRSQIHWDLVLLQTDEYGGGDIYFDGVLIRKNGLFVDPRLSALNPS